MKDEIIKSINDSIAWLDKNSKSNQIVSISRTVDNLLVKAATLGEETTKAYALMNELEDEYKYLVAKYVADSTTGVAKSEKEAEVKYHKKKKDWTEAKNTYRRFNSFLERIDKICDARKQTISVLKNVEMKNL